MDIQVVLKEEDYKELLKYKEYYEKNLIRFVYGNYQVFYYKTDDKVEKVKNEGFQEEGVFKTKSEGFYSINDFCIRANETLKTIQREEREKNSKANETITQLNNSYIGLKKWILSNSNVLKQYKKDFGDIPFIPLFSCIKK